jgi:hypothetical protein
MKKNNLFLLAVFICTATLLFSGCELKDLDTHIKILNEHPNYIIKEIVIHNDDANKDDVYEKISASNDDGFYQNDFITYNLEGDHLYTAKIKYSNSGTMSDFMTVKSTYYKAGEDYTLRLDRNGHFLK